MNYPDPILVNRYRGNTLESFHTGAICMINEFNEVIFQAGNITRPTFSRSALKPFQQILLVESGAIEHFGLTGMELAVMTGSHNGEKEHIDAVRSILKKAEIDEKLLQCGAQLPALKADRQPYIRKEKEITAITNNCSGKHAGFLLLSKYLGHPLETYISPGHPVQARIREIVAEMHEFPAGEMDTALDGCSAPIYSLPLRNQALGYLNLINPEKFDPKRQEACKNIVDSMLAYPFMVAGQKRYCTDLMEAAKGSILGKTGAEGIFSLAFPKQKISVAIKIDDGKMGPQYRVAQEIVKKSGILNESDLQLLEKYIREPVINWNKLETGIEEVNEDIFKDFPHSYF